MGKLSAEDEEQLEYIRKWYEMKEEKNRARDVRMVYVKFHFNMAKKHLAQCVNLLLGKAV